MSAKERFASSLEANSELSAEHAPGDVHESLWRNPPEIQRAVRNEFCIEHTSHIHQCLSQRTTSLPLQRTFLPVEE